VSHVGFGLVLGEDGKKFKTRSGDVVRLVEVRRRAAAALSGGRAEGPAAAKQGLSRAAPARAMRRRVTPRHPATPPPQLLDEAKARCRDTIKTRREEVRAARLRPCSSGGDSSSLQGCHLPVPLPPPVALGLSGRAPLRPRPTPPRPTPPPHPGPQSGDPIEEEELEKAACAMGYGAVKYADLKNSRLTNYKFSFDTMLDLKGNTAVYLQVGGGEGRGQGGGQGGQGGPGGWWAGGQGAHGGGAGPPNDPLTRPHARPPTDPPTLHDPHPPTRPPAQYAHARIASIVRKAGADPDALLAEGKRVTLEHPKELQL
jgi:hypothetical protein